MSRCALCKKEVDLPFRCSYCNQYFCEVHRLPENHMCPSIPKGRNWNLYNWYRNRYDYSRKTTSVKYDNPKRYEYPWNRNDFIDKSTYSKKYHINRVIDRFSNYLYTTVTYVMILLLAICVVSSLLNTSYIPDVFSHGYFQNNDVLRFYFANIGSFFDWIKSWGWFFIYIIPIPIIPLTTDYSKLFVIRGIAIFIGYYILISLVSRLNNRKLLLITIVLVPVILFGLVEQERRSLIDFQTRQELINFLKSDQVDKEIYNDNFTCEDFSRTLIKNAREQGYLIYYHTTTTHAFCEAYIKSENNWIFIEPQTDEIFYDEK